MVNVAALFESVEDRPRYEGWVQAFADEIRQDDEGAYVNFLEDEGEERVHAAYPGATWDRLREIKRRYDPDESLPAQPEHPTGMRARSGAAPLPSPRPTLA